MGEEHVGATETHGTSGPTGSPDHPPRASQDRRQGWSRASTRHLWPAIVARVQRDPTTNLRGVAAEMGLSFDTVCRAVRSAGIVRKRGFGSPAMDRDRQREIASRGGRRAQASGKAHHFTRETGSRAGKLGWRSNPRNREVMAEIGRKGGKASQANRKRKELGDV